MKNNNAIVLHNLSIGYGKKGNSCEILNGINLSGKKGELIALMGENGSGKSTLLKTIIGELPILKGSIKLKGVDHKSFTRHNLSNLISYVSTEIIRVSNMDTESLVQLGVYKKFNWIGQVPEKEKKRVGDIISRCGLDKLKDRQINQLSDGERQRVMIARALVQDTPLILLDEPTAFLDVNNKYSVAEMLRTLTEEFGRTVLFSTHDINMVINEVDKVWLVHDGKVSEGAPEELVLDGSFQRLFQNKAVYFNELNGEIGIKKHLRGSIMVKAPELELFWIGKALTRIAYRIEFDKPDMFLEYVDNAYHLSVLNENRLYEFSSLYDLCQFLKTKH